MLKLIIWSLTMMLLFTSCNGIIDIDAKESKKCSGNICGKVSKILAPIIGGTAYAAELVKRTTDEFSKVAYTEESKELISKEISVTYNFSTTNHISQLNTTYNSLSDVADGLLSVAAGVEKSVSKVLYTGFDATKEQLAKHGFAIVSVSDAAGADIEVHVALLDSDGNYVVNSPAVDSGDAASVNVKAYKSIDGVLAERSLFKSVKEDLTAANADVYTSTVAASIDSAIQSGHIRDFTNLESTIKETEATLEKEASFDKYEMAYNTLIKAAPSFGFDRSYTAYQQSKIYNYALANYGSMIFPVIDDLSKELSHSEKGIIDASPYRVINDIVLRSAEMLRITISKDAYIAEKEAVVMEDTKLSLKGM